MHQNRDETAEIEIYLNPSLNQSEQSKISAIMGLQSLVTWSVYNNYICLGKQPFDFFKWYLIASELFIYKATCTDTVYQKLEVKSVKETHPQGQNEATEPTRREWSHRSKGKVLHGCEWPLATVKKEESTEEKLRKLHKIRVKKAKYGLKIEENM